MDGRKFDELARKLATSASRRSLLKGLIGGGAAVVGSRVGSSALAGHEGTVDICHLTGSASNPYVIITVAVEAAEANRHLRHGDQIRGEGPGGCCVDSDCTSAGCGGGTCVGGLCSTGTQCTGCQICDGTSCVDDDNLCTATGDCGVGDCSGGACIYSADPANTCNIVDQCDACLINASGGYDCQSIPPEECV